jgi:broad specificity phosphatase PhoE
MSTVYFITHPDVVINPAIPVVRWPLSWRGRIRMLKMLEKPWVSGVDAIYCSTEQKAIDGSAIISEALGIPVHGASGIGRKRPFRDGLLVGARV